MRLSLRKDIKMAKILANVGGMPITEEDVNEFLAGLGQRGAGYNNPEGRKVVLQQLIGNKLLLLDAKRNLLEGEAEFRAQLERVKDQLLTNYAGEKAIASVSVSEKECEEYYKANPEKFMTDGTVSASHILVETEEAALDILGKIEGGAMSFEDAAREYSSCPSKDAGGSLGEFGRGQMVPEFDTAVFSMEVGEVTKTPVKTQFGYHLIKLNSKTEASTIPYAEISGEIMNALLLEKRRAAYESKINQLKIMYPVDILA